MQINHVFCKTLSIPVLHTPEFKMGTSNVIRLYFLGDTEMVLSNKAKGGFGIFQTTCQGKL